MMEKKCLACCNNICASMDVLSHEHKATEWRLLIDASKISLLAVILNSRNKFTSIRRYYFSIYYL